MLKEYVTWVEANYDVDEVDEKLTDKRTGKEIAVVRPTKQTPNRPRRNGQSSENANPSAIHRC